MKLYRTNTLFNKAEYIACLAAIGVSAYAVEAGIMLDTEAYKANYKPWNAPHMVYINHRWVREIL